MGVRMIFKLVYFEHPHPLLVEILYGWAPGTLWGWALWGHSGVGQETLG